MESVAGTLRHLARPLARGIVSRVARTRFGRAIVHEVIRSAEGRQWTLLRVSNHQAMTEASFDDVAGRPERIEGFHDLAWLFSSNIANHGLSRLGFDEAAYLYKYVSSLEEPRAAEVGRYKGGTTFLLAAAGARVVSLDNDVVELGDQASAPSGSTASGSRFADSLMAALRRYGFADRVSLVRAGSRDYSVEPGSLDLVFLDANRGYEEMSRDFDHWWPGVAPGGRLVVRGREALSPGMMRFASEAVRRSDVEPAADPPGTFVVLIRRPSSGR